MARARQNSNGRCSRSDAHPNHDHRTNKATPSINGVISHPQLPSTAASPTALLTSEEVNFIFREPFIHSGYRRPGQPWRYYLASFFWLHNESLNVWTHALGCCLVLARAYFLLHDLGSWDYRSTALVGFVVGCLLNNFLSFSAHLLHSKSQWHHYCLYLLDYAGITFYNLGNGIGSMYCCSHPDSYASMERVFLPLVVLLNWLSFLVCVKARLHYKGHFQIQRKLIMVAVLALLGILLAWPMAGRYLDCLRGDPGYDGAGHPGGCSLASLNHITIVFVFFAVDALCYSAHAPERWWPGVFDIWGQGHQWFHVTVMVTQQLQLNSVHVDLVQRGRNHAVLTPCTLLTSYVALAVAMGLTLKVFSPAIRSRVADDDVHEHEHEKSR